MTVSAAGRIASFAQETGEAWVFLLVIEHATLATPIRLTTNQENLTAGGNLYVGYAFEIDVPEQSDQLPRVQIRVDNVDRVIVDALRAFDSQAKFTLSVVLASSPDVVEAGPYEFSLSDVEYDASVVSGQLVFQNILDEPYPGDSFTPGLYPGAF